MQSNVLLVTTQGVQTDYTRSIYNDAGPMTKTSNEAQPDFLSLSLHSYNRGTISAKAGSYVQVNTSTYGIWYTGYVITDPEIDYVGTQTGVPRWSFKFQCASEDVLLNKKPLGVIPPFLNDTQGNILKKLISILSPAGIAYDVSGIEAGMFLARYTVDPQQHFTNVVQDFVKASNYRFSCKSFAITFQPRDAAPLTISVDGSSEHFTPENLTLQPTSDSVINQAIVLGNLEPQNTMHEYFVGDGATSKFPLIASVYGADSATLLDDDFSSGQIDSTKWTVYDANGTVLTPYQGTLNVLGGSNNSSYDVHLDSANLIPLENALRITHGEFDFVANCSGVIGALMSGNVTSNLANCVYGLAVATFRTDTSAQVSPLFTGAPTSTLIHPLVNGGVDASQFVALDFTKRYIMRTILATNRATRQQGSWSYVNSQGVVTQIPGGSVADTAIAYTWISEIDPTTAAITRYISFTNTVNLSAAQFAAVYCPIISDYCNLTLTSVTVSIPLQAVLRHAAKGTNTWHVAPVGPNEVDSYDGLAPVATVTDSNTGATARSSTLGTKNFNPGNAALTYFSDQPVALPISTLAAINPDLSAVPNPIRVPWDTGVGSTVVSWDNGPSTNMQLRKNGIVVANGGSSGTYADSSVKAGDTYYLYDMAHSGVLVDQLTCELETMYIPQVGDFIWFQYRTAGTSIGVAQDNTSIAAESLAWSDDGVRSVTVMDTSPQPRNSFECEIAATAKVFGNNYQHYQGTYTMQSGAWFSGEPVAGTVILFKNLPASFPSYLQAEAVTVVQTTFDHLAGGESFTHSIQFGPINFDSAALATLRSSDQVFAPQDSAQIPLAIDVRSLGNTTVPDVTQILFSSRTPTAIGCQIADIIPAGGFEVRYTDSGWGADSGANLVTRTTSGLFSLPRNNRGRIAFVRGYDIRNYALGSEDLANASYWYLSSGSVTTARGLDIDGQPSRIATIVLPNGKTFGHSTALTAAAAHNQHVVFSLDLAGVPGQTLTMQVNDAVSSYASMVVTLRATWQRVSVSALIPSTATGSITVLVVNNSGTSVTFNADRASLEVGTSIETIYCKTTSTPYGALSRFSCGVRFGFPLIPQAPTAAIDPTQLTTNVINITLPLILQDVWGIEVRASDNVTVLSHQDLTQAGYSPSVSVSGNILRSVSYFVYTYNILGEYSAPFNATQTWGLPGVASMSINSASKSLLVVAENAVNVKVLVQQPPAAGNPTINIVAQLNLPLAYGPTPQTLTTPLIDNFFFPGTYFWATPSDDLGSGPQILFGHTYFPTGVVELTSTEVASVSPPSAAGTLPAIPQAAATAPDLYTSASLSNYTLNKTVARGG